VALPQKNDSKKKSFSTGSIYYPGFLRNFPHTTGELSRLLRDIGLAARRINVEVNKAYPWLQPINKCAGRKCDQTFC